jgi:hypothetical protein
MSQPAYRVTVNLPEVRLDRVVYSFEEASQVFVDWLESLNLYRENVHGEIVEVLEIVDGHFQDVDEGIWAANILADGTVINYDAHGRPRILYQRSPDDTLTAEPVLVQTMAHLHVSRLIRGMLEAVESHKLDGELIRYDLTVPQLDLLRRIALGEIGSSVFYSTRQRQFDLALTNARIAILRLQGRNGVEETDQDPNAELDF